MFGLGILDVAIGMAFLYLFMSMIASALREALEAFFKNRATDLERGIQEMLRTDATTGGKRASDLMERLRSLLPTWLVGEWKPSADNWADKLYSHPLVSSLFKGTYEEARGTRNLPSYVPKENFATAILDIVANASATGNQLSVAQLTTELAKSSPPNAVQRAVLLALSTAGNDLEQVKTSVEAWYDSTMERVTGWYTARTTLILFLLGLGAAVALNVDSITVVKRLLNDPTLRSAIVKQAETFAKEEKDPTKAQSFETLRKQLGEIGFPIGWTKIKDRYYPVPQACTADASGETATKSEGGAVGATGPIGAAEPADAAEPNDGAAPAGAAKPSGAVEPAGSAESADTVEPKDAPEPAGSAKPEGAAKPYGAAKPASAEKPEVAAKPEGVAKPKGKSAIKPALRCETPSSLTMALAGIGWLITAIAIMLGAPFWFDTLKKLISVRSALNPDETKKKKDDAKKKNGRPKRRGGGGQGGGGGQRSGGTQGGGTQGGGTQGGGTQGGGTQGSGGTQGGGTQGGGQDVADKSGG